MRRRAALLAPLVALTFALAGCGGGEEAQPLPETVSGTLPAQTESTATATETGGGGGGVQGDPAAGKQIFAQQGCASCHTLSAAGASGTVGPNLDDAKPAYDLIIERVTNGKSPMPSFKDTLSEQQIMDVAAFVYTSTHS
ncbi:MAG TPA: cytochrome c [Gaiellaceae bacterium]|nr:cytochrome c [Gaiellaceae bacterium]